MALSPGEIVSAVGEGEAWSTRTICTSSGRPLTVSVTCGGPTKTHGLLELLTSVTPSTIEPVAPFELELVCRSAVLHRRTSLVGEGRGASVLAVRVQAQLTMRSVKTNKVFRLIVRRVYHQATGMSWPTFRLWTLILIKNVSTLISSP